MNSHISVVCVVSVTNLGDNCKMGINLIPLRYITQIRNEEVNNIGQLQVSEVHHHENGQLGINLWISETSDP